MSHWLYEGTTTNVEPKWVPPCDRRNTLGLLQTCILTMTLCSWTAVHLDIASPEERRSWFWLSMRKFGYMLYAVVVPEFLFAEACHQFLVARAICLELRRQDQEAQIAHPQQLEPGRWNCWYSLFPPNLEFGYYIAMGGYQVVEKNPNGEVRRILGALTPKGAIELRRMHCLPLISIAEIKDRSKANMLAKGLVCVQVTWLVLQCIARKATGLPTTLLEVNTVMHVTVTLLMYLMWLRKPLDIALPTEVVLTPNAEFSIKIENDIMSEDGTPSMNFLCIPYESMGAYWGSWDVPFSPINRTLANAIVNNTMIVIYAAIHLSQWDAHFPSNLERMLWIGSCGFLIIQAVAFTCYDWLGGPDPESRWRWIFVFPRLSFLSFFLASLYLVLESFLSVRSLPAGAYKGVRWTEFFPHF